MTDSRPEITARVDGAFIRLFTPCGDDAPHEYALFPEECFALQCQLSAAYQAVTERQGVMTVSYTGLTGCVVEGNRWVETTERPETWRTREPLC